MSETTSRFRAVFSFGPTNDIRGYGSEFLRFDTANPLELLLRTPERWLSSIESPTFVLEGNQPPSNAAALNALQQGSTNPKVTFLGVRGATHFNVLAPLTELIARKIQADVGPQTNIAIDASELGLRFAN